MLPLAEVHYVLAFILSLWGVVFGSAYIALITWKGYRGEESKVSYAAVHIGYVLSLLFFAALTFYVQYNVWFSNAFTHTLAIIPLGGGVPLPGLLAVFKTLFMGQHGYLLHYEFVHVWLALLWSMIAAGILGLMLVALRARRPLLMNSAEAHFIFAGALASGWPGVIVFLVLLFTIFVLHSLLNSIKGSPRTVIFPSAICAIVLTLILQNAFASALPGLQYLHFAL